MHGSSFQSLSLQVPPLYSSLRLTLLLVRVPTPHVTEQLPICHASHSQWTAEINFLELSKNPCLKIIHVFGHYIKVKVTLPGALGHVSSHFPQFALPGTCSPLLSILVEHQ